MKKVSYFLATFMVFVTARFAGAQQSDAVVNIPVAQLRAAYRASFGHDPNLGVYEQLALAINRSRDQYFPGAVGGFWNGVVNQNGADHSQDTYSIVTIGQGRFGENPQRIPLKALGAALASVVGRPPNFAAYSDLALSIDRYQAQSVHCSGGFWNGERAFVGGVPAFGIVWVSSAAPPQNVPVEQLIGSFAARTQRQPNFAVYGDMAFAVTCWIEDHEKGQALGGFWNGEKVRSDAGMVYGIVMVK
jgi:hypothetical protein